MNLNLTLSYNGSSPLVLFHKDYSKVFTDNTNADSFLQDAKSNKLSGIQKFSVTPDSFAVQIAEQKGLDLLEEVRVASHKTGKFCDSQKLTDVTIALDQASEEEFRAVVQGLLYSTYSFQRYKSEPTTPTLESINLWVAESFEASAQKIIEEETTIHLAVNTCRDFVNIPGSDLTPEIYVHEIESLFHDSPVNIMIRDSAQLEKDGFTGINIVGKGSPNKPYMVTLNYSPEKAKDDLHLAFVGKGVTFDTGGLSLKPPGGMWEMRMDMGGSATTLAAFKGIVDLKLPIRLTAVVCLAENRPGLAATLPGDIFKAKNGKTIQVENTDAEGRLVLTDGLAEAGDHKATHVIDMATLTGAIIRAIGTSLTGLFCNDEELQNQLVSSGKDVGEKFWPMPLEMEYRESLDDKVADLRNIGGDAGAVTAALFLQEFIPEGAKWAHLDIAGTAFVTKSWKYYDWGATGWGVRSLIQLAKTMSK